MNDVPTVEVQLTENERADLWRIVGRYAQPAGYALGEAARHATAEARETTATGALFVARMGCAASAGVALLDPLLLGFLDSVVRDTQRLVKEAPVLAVSGTVTSKDPTDDEPTDEEWRRNIEDQLLDELSVVHRLLAAGDDAGLRFDREQE